MFPNEALLAIIDDYTRSFTLEVHLVQAYPAASDVNVELDDLLALECDYPGYAPMPFPDPGAAVIDGGGQGDVTSPTLTFQPTGMTTPQTIFGYWLDFLPRLGSPRKLFLWHRMLTPYTLTNDLSKFERKITLKDQDYAP